MNKRLLTAVLFLGLLFYCPKVYAYDVITPTAGFTEFVEDIECVSKEPLPSYILTEEDAKMLLQLGVLEAGEVDVEGIAYVMQVVLNRFESDEFPNTVEGVIFQKKQFCTAKRLSKAHITPEAEEALMAVVNGEYKDVDSLYFESLPGKVWDDELEYMFTYNGHDFYK